MSAAQAQRKLKMLTLSFVLLLAIPACVLFWYSVEQLENEAESVYANLAKALADRIDASIELLIKKEQKRSFAEYQFIPEWGVKQSSYSQPSPLARFPVNSDIPGLLGYFQVDPEQNFSTPVLPFDGSDALNFGITEPELRQRQRLSDTLFGILSTNRLVANIDSTGNLIDLSSAEADRASSESEKSALPELNISSRAIPQGKGSLYSSSSPNLSFDELESAPVAEFSDSPYEQLDESLWDKQVSLSRAPETKAKKLYKQEAAKTDRKEKNVVADTAPAVEASKNIAVSMFDSEVDAFKFSFLSSGHIILFRSAWYEGQKYIQGLIIDQDAFIESLIITPFSESSLAPMTKLILVYSEQIFKAFKLTNTSNYRLSQSDLSGEFSVKYSLSSPLDKFDLVYTASDLPLGPQATIIIVTALAFLSILFGGSYFLYRVGLRQIDINTQQRNFVSSVSHELKTPLTSIRMYGEALSKGWASEAQKTEYYDYILKESERLSRLIHNILQLSQAERGELKLNNQAVYVGELVELITQKIQRSCEAKHFTLKIVADDTLMDQQVNLDKDAFTQVAINLIDNSMKFAHNAERQEIHIHFERQANKLVIGFRDYGPGIAKEHMGKVFDFFYRAENELTRSTKGTGIGLALVSYLMSGMNANITVEAKDPGVEFILSFLLEG